MVVAILVGPEADRLVLVVDAQQLFDGHAAIGFALTRRVDNVGEDAVVVNEAEVVVDVRLALLVTAQKPTVTPSLLMPVT